jgi:phosphatidylserine/phosphatidylglycerophosphate/cardiolipin synthase-like enzyme
MKHLLILLLAASAMVVTGRGQDLLGTNPVLPAMPKDAHVWFSNPESVKSQLNSVVIDYLNQATREILIDAYAITDVKIVQELGRLQLAKANKIRIYVILEERPMVKNYVTPAFLTEANILVLYSKGGVNDSNYMVIDGKEVLTGAFNYTQAHSTQAVSNLVLVTDPAQVESFRDHFIHHMVKTVLPSELHPKIDDIRKELQEWFLPKSAKTEPPAQTVTQAVKDTPKTSDTAPDKTPDQKPKTEEKSKDDLL